MSATRVHELEFKLNCARNNIQAVCLIRNEAQMKKYHCITNSTLSWNTFKQTNEEWLPSSGHFCFEGP